MALLPSFCSIRQLPADSPSRARISLPGGFLGSKVTSIASAVWKEVVRPGDTVIDATVGNGIDTLLLTRLVSSETLRGRVYGFDVQNTALERTLRLLEKELDLGQRKQVELFHSCHSKMDDVLKDVQARLVVYNLGYLPHGDKELVTSASTTVKSLQCAVDLLQPGGLVSIVCYVGHPGGREEYEAVKEFASLLPSDWVCSHLEQFNKPIAPHLVLLGKQEPPVVV